MTTLVKAIEIPYRGVNRLRRALYRAGALTPRRLPRPVISVGNIAAGGTGKTPAVIALCRFLAANGLRVAVLTRGYGALGSGVIDRPDTLRFGDEPVLIKKRVPEVDVIVGASRYANAVLYLSSTNCDCFVLDDGFQHLQLHRDLDIVIDAPSALMREGRRALRDADIVIPRRLTLQVPEHVQGRRLFAFSGLADNRQFVAALRAQGLEVVAERGFPDHHRYTAADLDAIESAARAADAERIVTTEKDAVKILPSPDSGAAPESLGARESAARPPRIATASLDIVAVPAEFEFDLNVLDAVLRAVRK